MNTILYRVEGITFSEKKTPGAKGVKVEKVWKVKLSEHDGRTRTVIETRENPDEKFPIGSFQEVSIEGQINN